jgi:hypothetical protein
VSTRQRKRRESRRREHSASSPIRRRLVAAGGATAGATLAMSGVAHAAPQTYTVGTNADSSILGDCTSPTNSDCSLREAVGLANGNTGADTIVFNSNLTGATIDLTTGALSISERVTISGPGAAQLTVDAGGNSRIFYIDLGLANFDPVSISGLTLTNGYTGGRGGAIYNYDADLTVSSAVVSDSYAGGQGGDIYSYDGQLTVNASTVSGGDAFKGGGLGSYTANLLVANSTVSGNTAFGAGPTDYSDAYGGGVWAGDANVTVKRSTINDNNARDGGGIYADNGNVAVQNSTISSNHAVQDDGGGVWLGGGSLTVTGSTVTNNTAATETGGLQSFSSTTQVIENSIVSGNTGNPASTNDVYSSSGYYFDTSFSLIGVPSGYINTTVPGSNLFGVNPQLGALAYNGGPTQTQLPANTSPVIDKGKSFGLTTDQRALNRPIEIPSIPNSTAAGADGADMGAVELQSVPTVPSSTPTPIKKKKCSAESAKKKKCKKKKKK